MFARLCRISVLLLGLGACSDPAQAPEAPPADGQRLVLYTSLPVERVNGLAAAFRSETGIAIDFKIDAEAELLDALKRKENVPSADVLLIAGVGNLAEASDSDLFRPLQVQPSSVPESLRDPDGYWASVGIRAEFIVYDGRSVAAGDLGGYADLAEVDWHGKLCLQRSTAERSRALIGLLIAQQGERAAERVVRGWRNNLATSVFDDQQDMLAAIGAGQCAVAIASSEQITRFLSSPEATPLKVHAPPLEHGGTFRNIVGAGVSRHATNPELGERFVAWLSSVEGQGSLHSLGGEFPATTAVPPADALSDWASYSPSSESAASVGFNVPDAVLLAERARYR